MCVSSGCQQPLKSTAHLLVVCVVNKGEGYDLLLHRNHSEPPLATDRVLSSVVPLLFEESLGHVFLRDGLVQLLIDVPCLASFPREESCFISP